MKVSAAQLLLVVNVAAALAVIGVAAKVLVVPPIARYLYKDKYKQLMFQCDDVMRNHFIAKAGVRTNPSEETVKSLRSAEVSLLACHDYDKLRKKLLMLGLSEIDLSSLGLEAIEERAKDIIPFVKMHEIRY